MILFWYVIPLHIAGKRRLKRNKTNLSLNITKKCHLSVEGQAIPIGEENVQNQPDTSAPSNDGHSDYPYTSNYQGSVLETPKAIL